MTHDKYSINYMSLVAPMIESIKELKYELDRLKELVYDIIKINKI